MAGKNTVVLTFAGKDDGLSDTFDRVADKGESAFSKVNQVATFASAAVVGTFGAWATNAISAAEESEQSFRQLEQVFESMGGTSSEAFQQAADAAEELGRQIAIDDDEIRKVQTKLATFGNIWRDPVVGAENFNRATQIAFDLASAGFGSAESNAAQLGRALNDPISGMTALTRAGVTFTEAEKERIKALQESGKLTEAQEIVLQALEQQVGGVAEASVTDSQRMQLAISELSESFGKLLLPAVKELADWVVKLTDFIEDHKTAVAIAGGVLVGLAAGVLAVNAAVKVWRATVLVATAAQWLWNIAMKASPIGLIILAITALIAIIILVVKNWDTVKAAFEKAWDFIWGHLKAFGKWLWDTFWTNGLKKVFDLQAAVLNWIKDRFVSAFNRAKEIAGNAVDFIGGLPRRIRSAFSNLFNIITSPFRSAFNFVARAWNNTVGRLSWSVPSWVPVVGGNSISAPRLPTFHKGGIVPGAPGQEVMALLQAGERVIPAGRSGDAGGTTVVASTSGTGVEQAFTHLVLHLIRTGAIRLSVQNGRVAVG